MEGSPVAGVRPHAAAFPAGIGIVDTPVKSVRPEAHGIRHDQIDGLAIFEGDQRVVLIAGGEGNIVAQPERVVLVGPCIVGRFPTAVLGDPIELRSRQWIKRPALGTVLAGRGWAVQGAFALAAVEAAEMAARERGPHDALAVDVSATGRESRQRYIIYFRKCGWGWARAWIDPDDGAGVCAQGAP